MIGKESSTKIHVMDISEKSLGMGVQNNDTKSAGQGHNDILLLVSANGCRKQVNDRLYVT